MTLPYQALMLSQNESLAKRLDDIHQSILDAVAAIDRVACALYDPVTGLLETFVSSNRQSRSMRRNHHAVYRNCAALKHIASSRHGQLVQAADESVTTDPFLAPWLATHGCDCSFIVPLFAGDDLIGFLLFDSQQTSTLNAEAQRDVLVHGNLIVMAILSEVSAVNSLLATTKTVHGMVHVRDFETGEHLARMARLSRLIAQGVASHYQLSSEFIQHVYLYSALHDIGKLGIPDDILLKPNGLTESEQAVMKSHVEQGVRLIDDLLNTHGLQNLRDSKILRNIVACHHELLDGSGYPNGLTSDQIPVEARIVTVADIFDALTCARPYKQPWSVDEAFNELQEMTAKGQLDVYCVNALLTARAEAEQIIQELKE